jgi:hypothetical protein
MRLVLLAAAVCLAGAPAVAQTRSGGLGGLLGGALPQVGSIGAGNAAGLLGYCVKNRLLGGDQATGVLGKLTGNPQVTQSPGFQLGQNGQVQQPGGGVLPLDGLKGQLKARVCDLVLKRAGSFLPR